MKIQISTVEPHENLILLADYERLLDKQQIGHQTIDIKKPFGTLLIEEIFFEGAAMFMSDFSITQPTILNISCHKFHWAFSFVIDGTFTFYARPGSKGVALGRSACQTFYGHESNITIELTRSSKVFTVCLDHDFIKRILPIKRNLSNEPFTFAYTIHNDNRVKLLIEDIMRVGKPEHIRRINIEARILDLLSIHIEQSEHTLVTDSVLNHDDIEKLKDAKYILEQNLQKPYSIMELARKSGLNDFKLKKGFKNLYGTTVFGYVTELRMDKAHQYLREGCTVKQVAEMVGYKNSQHFTVAFKKRYQVLPSKILNQ